MPKRGLGDATVQLLHDHARKRKIPIYDAAAAIITTDELKPKARGGLRTVIENFERWRMQAMNMPHTQLAEIVLDESGYTEMWQKDRSADAQGPPRQPEGAGPLDGRVSRTCKASSNTLRW